MPPPHWHSLFCSIWFAKLFHHNRLIYTDLTYLRILVVSIFRGKGLSNLQTRWNHQRGHNCFCQYPVTRGRSGRLRNHQLRHYFINRVSSVTEIFLGKRLYSQGLSITKDSSYWIWAQPRHLEIQIIMKRSWRGCNDIDISFLIHSQHSKSLTKEIFAVKVLCTPCITSISSLVWRCHSTELCTEWRLA